MPVKLFVASLPTSIRKKELITFFSKFGEIKRVELVTHKNSKKGKGFSFVTFIKEEDSEKVLSQRVFFKGRQLSIRRHLKGKQLEKYRMEFTKRRMFVGSIPLDCSEEELYSAFQHIGEIEKAYIIQDSQTQRANKYGYVVFRKVESMERALQMKHSMRGVVLNCQKFRGKNSYRGKAAGEGSCNPPSGPVRQFASGERSEKVTGNFQNSSEGQRSSGRNSSGDEGGEAEMQKQAGSGTKGSTHSCGELDFAAKDEGMLSKVALKLSHRVWKNHYRSNIYLRKPNSYRGWGLVM